MANIDTKIKIALPETGVKTGKATERVFKGQDTFRKQKPATIEEQLYRKSNLKTQGRKGCKLTRINFAITPEHLQYIKSLAHTSGLNMTSLLNRMIQEHMEKHPTLAAQSQAILDEIMGTANPKR